MPSRIVTSAVSLVAILSCHACVRVGPADAVAMANRADASVVLTSDKTLNKRVKATCRAIQMELHACITAMMDDRLEDPYSATARLRKKPAAERPVQQGSLADPIQSMASAERRTDAYDDPISRFAELSESRSERLQAAEKTCSMRAPHRKSVRSVCG